MSNRMTPSPNGFATPTPVTVGATPVVSGAGHSGIDLPPGPRLGEISNVSNDQPLRLADLCEFVFSRTDGWPVRVAGSLAVPIWDAVLVRWRIEYLAKPAPLIAWLDRFGQVRWSRKPGTYDKAEFLEAVRQKSARAGWATDVFVWPRPSDVVLANPVPLPRSTGALAAFLGQFAPLTEADAVLLKAFALTVFWGGPPGKRPLFVFSTGETGADPNAGRGSGKSTVAFAVGRLCGGHLSIGAKHDRDRLVTDLLSPAGLGVRLVVADNVKAIKFSWADLEAQVTAPTVDGHAMYVGHGSRPNYLTYCLTANEPVLSTDLASRAVPIELRQPRKSAAWDERFEHLLGDPAFRDDLYADVAWHLQQPVAGYEDDPDDRWPLWWRDVAYRACGSPAVLAQVRQAVRERRGGLDGDRAGREDLGAAAREAIRQATFDDPDAVVVLLPTAVLAPLLAPIVGKEVSATEAGHWMSVLAAEHFFREKNGPAPLGQARPRGYWWVGPNCRPGGPVPAYALRASPFGRPEPERLPAEEGERIVQKFRPSSSARPPAG